MKKSLVSPLFASLLFITPLTALAEEVLIQTGDAGTSATGKWYRASGASMAYNSNKGLYASVDNSSKTYTFKPSLPETTSYFVEVYNSCYSPRSHQVTHYIHHADGIATHVVDQDCKIDPYVGKWRSLGNYRFNAGTSGSLVIDTVGSNNLYVGATAVKFIYTPTDTADNNPPILVPSILSAEVEEGEVLSLSVMAVDAEDGDISRAVVWSAQGQTATGDNFSVTAQDSNFVIELSIVDSDGVLISETIPVIVNPLDVEPPPSDTTHKLFNFDCTVLEPLTGFVTNNPSALPNVGMRCGKYNAELTDNTNNKTLHFNNNQGRFDGTLVSFPFAVIARNVGPAPIGNASANHSVAGSAYHFVGLQVHHSNLENRNSAHLVVGQRGTIRNTIEGKMTRNGSSRQSDIGADRLQNGRADLMIVGDADGNISAYWQLPNLSKNVINDAWIPYSGTGQLPGSLPQWDSESVYIGLITYAYYSESVPFMGVVDSLEVSD